MTRRSLMRAACAAALLMLSMAGSACLMQPTHDKPRMALFIGVDASGSFERSGYYDDALSFLAHYLYGHLNELDGLSRPRELFVGSVGGRSANEPKAFHPIHDLEGKQIPEIQAALKEWFPPTDTLTDYNAFFQEVGRISQERNLTLAPITVLIVTDGVPDAAPQPKKADPTARYAQIDLGPMEYLSKNLTLRLTYVNPKVGQYWRKEVPRQRVRLWTVDADVMKGWPQQLDPQAEPAAQHRLWKWMLDNVDYRVRSRMT
ncbi:MAG: hypothetical protein HY208_07850 [Nitrospirae bacterium]|nr:hypothetical protein [Nitrospirota bacterium]